MRALVLEANGPTLRSDWPRPSRGAEALIRPTLAGVCATDLELVKGYMGFRGVLGHEWVGIVEDAPDPTWIGARVVGDINCPCGACPTCQAGRGTHCPTRTVLGILGRDGVFAERFSLPLANLHRVPDEVDDRAAVFVEPLAAALEITAQVHLRPTDRVVVIGVGRLGQLCARVLALTGAEVAAVTRNASRLALLPRGIRGVSLADAPRLAGADVVVDCTGAKDGLELATRLVRARGTIVLKTTVHGQTAQAPTPWVIDELTLIGSRCGPFEPALRLLASGWIDPRPLITLELPLSRGAEALARAAESGTVKVVLDPQH